jgi:hypothetical protein
LADQAAPEDEDAMRIRTRQLSYELAAGDWQPVPCAGSPAEPPTRFIDGSVFSRTVAVLTVDGSRRPAILACLGALALDMDGRRLVRPAGSLRAETVLCLLSNDVPEDHLLALGEGLGRLEIGLLASETEELAADFEVLRRRTWDLAKQRMEEAEQAVLFDQPNVPALVDGLLERRVVTAASQEMAAVGMVKRHHKQYVDDAHLNLLYELEPAERSPAFLIETKNAGFVSWYLRLSAADNVAPGYGVVRLTMPLAYLEHRFPRAAERFAEVSAISHYVCGLRHREGSYARMGISLEPIVRVEDELHAVLPDIRQATARLHRAMGI